MKTTMNKKTAFLSLATLALCTVWVSASSQGQVPGSGAKQVKGGGLPNQGRLPGPGGPQAPSKPPWQEFKLNPKTTMFLDFTDSNPDMIISIFSRTSGITILKDPTFKTPLTVTSAKAVSLNEAFEIFNTVLGLNNYELKKQGNLLLVSRKQPPQGPPMQAPPPPPAPVIKTYALKNASATQVARVINDIYSQSPAPGGGGNPGGNPGTIVFGPNGPQPAGGPPGGGPAKAAVKASAEEYSNAVVVSALPKNQTDIEALIKDLDRQTTQPLQSEMFHLKYVPAEDILSAVEDILTSNAPVGRGAAKQTNQNQGFFFGFDPFGGGNNRQRNAGGQTATAIKPTNSIIVNATPENIELIRKLLLSVDQPSTYVGTTFVLRLSNAKASDVADLLNKVFTQKTNNQDNNPFFFFVSDFANPNKNKAPTTDQNENGEIVNVRDLAGKVTINADPNTNSLIIVTQPSNMKMIRDVIEKIDRVAEQVMIETIIVEANLDKTTKLGVEWSFLKNGIFHNPNASNSGSSNFGLQGSVPALEGLTYTISSGTYRAFLNALATDSRFKVLDTPRIFTSNNVKAEINVSQRFPYITSQQTGIAGGLISNYQFQDVGVVLTVTPRITSSGQVTMDVVQSADDLQGFTSFNAPIINHRQATTTVSVADGQTIVLGGIIRNTITTSQSKIPLLGDIPLLGNLFKSSSKENNQTELMVFLTPHIVHDNDDAQRLRKSETDKLSKESQDSLKKQIPPASGG